MIFSAYKESARPDRVERGPKQLRAGGQVGMDAVLGAARLNDTRLRSRLPVVSRGSLLRELAKQAGRSVRSLCMLIHDGYARRNHKHFAGEP